MGTVGDDYYCVKTVAPLLSQAEHGIDPFRARVLRLFVSRVNAPLPQNRNPAEQTAAMALYQKARDNNSLAIQQSTAPFPIYLDKNAVFGALACYDHAPNPDIDVTRGEVDCSIKNSSGVLSDMKVNAVGKTAPSWFYITYVATLCLFALLFFVFGFSLRLFQRWVTNHMIPL